MNETTVTDTDTKDICRKDAVTTYVKLTSLTEGQRADYNAHKITLGKLASQLPKEAKERKRECHVVSYEDVTRGELMRIATTAAVIGMQRFERDAPAENVSYINGNEVHYHVWDVLSQTGRKVKKPLTNEEIMKLVECDKINGPELIAMLLAREEAEKS